MKPARKVELRPEDVKAIRSKRAELRRLESLAATDRYVADLVAEVGPPTAAERTRAAAVARRLARRPAR